MARDNQYDNFRVPFLKSSTVVNYKKQGKAIGVIFTHFFPSHSLPHITWPVLLILHWQSLFFLSLTFCSQDTHPCLNLLPSVWTIAIALISCYSSWSFFPPNSFYKQLVEPIFQKQISCHTTVLFGCDGPLKSTKCLNFAIQATVIWSH